MVAALQIHPKSADFCHFQISFKKFKTFKCGMSHGHHTPWGTYEKCWMAMLVVESGTPFTKQGPVGGCFAVKKWKVTFCVEAQKILDVKVACICELHNTAKNQPKIRLYGVELELRKVVRDECHVKSCLIVMCVKVPPQTIPKTQVLNWDVLVGHK